MPEEKSDKPAEKKFRSIPEVLHDTPSKEPENDDAVIFRADRDKDAPHGIDAEGNVVGADPPRKAKGVEG